MIDDYIELPYMYKAELIKTELVLTEVSPLIYMRFGTQGLGKTKVEAIEILRKGIMVKFNREMGCINWQAREYGE